MSGNTTGTRHEETNVCEVIAIVTQRTLELDEELKSIRDTEGEHVYVAGQRDELIQLCQRLGWAKYLDRDIDQRLHL